MCQRKLGWVFSEEQPLAFIFPMVHISIFGVIKFLSIFLIGKCISLFPLCEACFWKYTVYFICWIARQGNCTLKNVYVHDNGYFWWKFYIFIFLLIYMLPLMSKCNIEIRNIELQSRHPFRKYVSSLNSHGFQHFKTGDFGKWANVSFYKR